MSPYNNNNDKSSPASPPAMATHGNAECDRPLTPRASTATPAVSDPACVSPLDRVTVQDLITGVVNSMASVIRDSEARTAALVAEAVANSRAEAEARSALFIEETVAARVAEIAKSSPNHKEDTVNAYQLQTAVSEAEQRMQSALAAQCAKVNDVVREETRQIMARDRDLLVEGCSALSARVDVLTSITDDSQGHLRALQASLGDMRSQMNDLQSSLGAIQQRQEILEARQMTLLRDHGALKTDLSSLKADQNSKKADIKAIKSRQEACEQQLQGFESRLRSQKKDMVEVHKAQKRLDKQPGMGSIKLKELTTAQEVIQGKHEDMVKTQLELRESLDAVEERGADFDTAIASFKTQLIDMKDSYSALRQQHALLKEEVLRLKLFRVPLSQQSPWGRTPDGDSLETLLKNESRLESGFSKMVKRLDKRLLALENVGAPGISPTLDARLAQLGAEIESVRNSKEKLELAFRKDVRKQQKSLTVIDNRIDTQDSLAWKIQVKLKALALAVAHDMDLDDFSADDYPDLLTESRRLARFSRDPHVSIEATTHARWLATEIERRRSG
ncbi:hypothetical protein A1Q1_02433 [Trichosporon asahii var. asahii CBS 2479]|uniref:Uncharacterized protein n=1 Tax=Trichosporon asahii var. asahii (strain ATCC 90039 / CBS 2479 / JCM 2466 / KCTC 7840 / NBRC 103889/ NCYC 2677 / UAMH 7654) TaxID=1186058 RepID=J4UC58_TRIAS|nr:hypothetical protein A1Q1_02433 [Trichosporon asahii var. asahii CBS 2479]EJT48525.1 hypothetical protein A1Q1_02433 [Trichosporon asahii var. asahii CBS 2479]